MNFKPNTVYVLISQMDVRVRGTMLFKGLDILPWERVIFDDFNHEI